jgi:transposase InsO family protein
MTHRLGSPHRDACPSPGDVFLHAIEHISRLAGHANNWNVSSASTLTGSLPKSVEIHLTSARTWTYGSSPSTALDNALMESQIGLYKTELIKPRKPWKGLADVEVATAEWVDWFNHQRLHTAIGHIPPTEHETNYYAQRQPQPVAGVSP